MTALTGRWVVGYSLISAAENDIDLPFVHPSKVSKDKTLLKVVVFLFFFFGGGSFHYTHSHFYLRAIDYFFLFTAHRRNSSVLLLFTDSPKFTTAAWHWPVCFFKSLTHLLTPRLCILKWAGKQTCLYWLKITTKTHVRAGKISVLPHPE